MLKLVFVLSIVMILIMMLSFLVRDFLIDIFHLYIHHWSLPISTEKHMQRQWSVFSALIYVVSAGHDFQSPYNHNNLHQQHTTVCLNLYWSLYWCIYNILWFLAQLNHLSRMLLTCKWFCLIPFCRVEVNIGARLLTVESGIQRI